MKLRDLSPEVAIWDARLQIGRLLSESISDYLAHTIAALKNEQKVDLDQLAEFISGLKMLGDDERRSALSKEDLGINPNNFKELFNVLSSVSKTGKDLPKMTDEVFDALRSMSPSGVKNAREELSVLENGTRAQKQEAIKKLQDFTSKFNQFFYKIKHGAAKPKDRAVDNVVGDQFDNVGGLPS